MIDRKFLKRAAAMCGITVSDKQAEQFDIYADMLVAWNTRLNLTTITDPTDMVIKHFVDCIAAAPFLPEGAFSMLDVGSGAGFPGIPLTIMRPDCRLTLLDSQMKRLVFLEAISAELQIPSELVHIRAEAGSKKPDMREQFDVVTARAVAALPTLCEYCIPYVKPGGRFLPLKGKLTQEEYNDGEFAMSLLGARIQKVKKFVLPPDSKGECAERTLVWAEKIAPTPPAFPRTPAQIKKCPM